MSKFSLGKIKITVTPDKVNSAFQIILEKSLSYESFSFNVNGEGVFIVSVKNKERFAQEFEKNDIIATFSDNYGLGAVVTKYKKRYGAFIGIFLMLIIVYTSSLFVWDIRIDGNTSTKDEEILKTLNDCGFSLGSFIPKIDYDKLHNTFLLKSDKISWISVNIVGNVANVSVKERMTEEEKPQNTYSNVVAKCDGQIALIRLYDGIKTVKLLDIVKEGDILISGVIDSQSEGVRYVHADGVVNAYVNKHISIKIPMMESVKEYTGTINSDKSVKIFSKYINIFKKNSNCNKFYDKIEVNKNVVLFNKIKLPVVVTETIFSEYVYKDVSYTEREAKELASVKLREELDIALKNAELLSKRVNYYCDYEFYYIECDLYCIEDIAKVVEFKVG